MSKKYIVSETGGYTFNKCNKCNKLYFDINYKCCSHLNENSKNSENSETIKHSWKNCTNIKCNQKPCSIMWKYKMLNML